MPEETNEDEENAPRPVRLSVLVKHLGAAWDTAKISAFEKYLRERQAVKLERDSVEMIYGISDLIRQFEAQYEC